MDMVKHTNLHGVSIFDMIRMVEDSGVFGKPTVEEKDGLKVTKFSRTLKHPKLDSLKLKPLPKE